MILAKGGVRAAAAARPVDHFNMMKGNAVTVLNPNPNTNSYLNSNSYPNTITNTIQEWKHLGTCLVTCMYSPPDPDPIPERSTHRLGTPHPCFVCAA